MDNTAQEEIPEEDLEYSEDVSADIAGQQESVDAGEIFFDKDIRILYQEPIKHLDKGTIHAYRAIGKSKVVSDLVAFVCDKSLTPRRMSAIKYSKVVNPNLAKLVGSGKVLWPEAKEERFCFIYENTFGKPILSRGKPLALGFKPEDVLSSFAYPLIAAFTDMRNKDLVHGEVWPGNMFSNSAQREGVVTSESIRLGECLTTPSSYNLPALFEPIERALADPIGRGTGTFADDLYSFGVSLAVLLRTSDPLQGMSDDDIIRLKLEKGSYATVIGKERLSGALLELLRGLLYDDPAQRWTIDDVQAWKDGRRLSPKQSSKRVKASRPIIVGNKKYTRPELLAKDIWRQADEIAKIVDNGELGQWIDRAIEDKSVKSRMEQFFKDNTARERSSGYNERLSVAVATSLFPECPIRYKGLNFIPSGFGKVLSHAYVKHQDMQPFSDIMRYNFVIPVIRGRKATDTSSIVAKFDSCRAFVSQSRMGAGIERAIYLMDQECPCLSPIIDKYYVLTPEELMDAFEAVCSSSEPKLLFDRHIAAFLSVKDRKNIDPYIGDLNAKESYRRALGQIRTLATIQQRSRLGKFPAITQWLANNLEDLYERFHDGKKRQELKRKVETIVQKGDLSELAHLFDDPKLYQNDVGGFYQAMEEYRRINQEKLLIEEKLENKKDYGQKTGQQIASVVAMFLSLAIILITTYVMVLKGL